MNTMDSMKDWFTGSGTKTKGSGEVLTTHTVVGLTALGGSQVERGSLQGKMYEVGATLKDEGASSIGEINQITHISVEQLKHIVKAMFLKGYVRKVGADES
jgi:hypothetical protein